MGHETINGNWNERTKCRSWFFSRWADVIILREPHFDRYVINSGGHQYLIKYCPFCGVKLH